MTGGNGMTGTFPLKSTEIFWEGHWKWEMLPETADLPTARLAMGGVSINNKIIMIGWI